MIFYYYITFVQKDRLFLALSGTQRERGAWEGFINSGLNEEVPL
jgi:hypothetical protein